MVTKLGPPIFSKKNVYGKILKFLYYHRGDRLGSMEIVKKFKGNNANYIRTCIEWLIEDQLIKAEEIPVIKEKNKIYVNETVIVYRISHEGYKFMLELTSNQYSFWFSLLAFLISIIAIIISYINV